MNAFQKSILYSVGACAIASSAGYLYVHAQSPTAQVDNRFGDVGSRNNFSGGAPPPPSYTSPPEAPGRPSGPGTYYSQSTMLPGMGQLQSNMQQLGPPGSGGMPHWPNAGSSGSGMPYGIVTQIPQQQFQGYEFDPRLQEELRQLNEEMKRVESSNNRKAIVKRYRSALERVFDNDLRQREKHIEDLESRIDKLRGQLSRRESQKDRIIDLQVQLAENEADGLGFNNPAQTSSTSNAIYNRTQEFQHGGGSPNPQGLPLDYSRGFTPPPSDRNGGVRGQGDAPRTRDGRRSSLDDRLDRFRSERRSDRVGADNRDGEDEGQDREDDEQIAMRGDDSGAEELHDDLTEHMETESNDEQEVDHQENDDRNASSDDDPHESADKDNEDANKDNEDADKDNEDADKDNEDADKDNEDADKDNESDDGRDQQNADQESNHESEDEKSSDHEHDDEHHDDVNDDQNAEVKNKPLNQLELDTADSSDD